MQQIIKYKRLIVGGGIGIAAIYIFAAKAQGNIAGLNVAPARIIALLALGASIAVFFAYFKPRPKKKGYSGKPLYTQGPPEASTEAPPAEHIRPSPSLEETPVAEAPDIVQKFRNL